MDDALFFSTLEAFAPEEENLSNFHFKLPISRGMPSDSADFSIDAAQIVALFMETLFYGMHLK